MELQFNKSLCRCMKTVVRQVQNQEQTQEIRLPDGLPDIGSILGAWGQVVLRSKEWHTGSMNISGGVMAWVLYMSDEDTTPQCVETWIPFQMKWEFPDSDRDGVMHSECLLRSIDARTISARKMMVRAGIGVMSQAFVADEYVQYTPPEVPEDVQMLWKKYPVCMPKEAGEKVFELEEELSLPASCPGIHKILRYELIPAVLEDKIVSGRLVFRGTGRLHLMYCGEDGGIYTWDFEVPFSQYTDLDDTYEESATVEITPVVTGLEVESGEDGNLLLKAGLAAQYVVYDCTVLECVVDAYSTANVLTPVMTTLAIPAVLERRGEDLEADVTIPDASGRIVDAAFYPDHPRVTREHDVVTGEFPGVFQVLYYDEQGSLQGVYSRWEDNWELPADEEAKVLMRMQCTEMPRSAAGGGSISLRSTINAEAETWMQKGIEVVCGLSAGEKKERKADMPSLILRRMGEDSLWDIAKELGSTVDAIEKVNRLTAEPSPRQMLLIPVI